jgi:xanthine dehydrogenase small subunit
MTSIQLIKGGRTIKLVNVPPSRTLLEVLREDLGSTATKEGCGEGDCGACTVVLGEKCGDGVSYRAVNSCIRLAHSVDGMAVWTAEDIAGLDGALHPVQQALVESHASQCGFCTPGFVMSMFAMYQNYVGKPERKGHATPAVFPVSPTSPISLTSPISPISRELAQAELSGNLCRCTGYRPILDAAQMLHTLPVQHLDESVLLQKLELLAPDLTGLQADLMPKAAYQSPVSLKSLLSIRAANPSAQIVAGCTDVGLWVTKQHRQFDQIIDITKVAELRRIEDYPHHIAIGAAVTLNDAFAAMVKDRPQLASFAARFAGLPVRNSATLGGNVANGSPIGDSMPLLIALNANVVLMSVRGHREMPLEQLYTGYRQNVMASDEVLAWIKVPKPVVAISRAAQGRPKQASAPSVGSAARVVASVGAELLRIYKISKRFDDDISAICLALNFQMDNGIIVKASIGVGGVAATPVRAIKTEAACARQTWARGIIDHLKEVLRAEFQPISDMRASSAYRTQVLGNLLERFWLESQGMQQINLESFSLAGDE